MIMSSFTMVDGHGLVIDEHVINVVLFHFSTRRHVYRPD
jgi:hypothetical protein